MKRIVIGIKNASYANQFGLNDFHGEVSISTDRAEYFIHTSPVIKLSPRCKLNTNFDILINNTHPLRDANAPEFTELLPAHRVFNNDRTAKSIMRYKMNQAASALNIKNFLNVGHWANDNTLLPHGTGRYGNDVGYAAENLRVVIKDEFGARGAGQVLFKITDHSPGTVMKVMTKIHNRALLEPDLSNDALMDEIKQRLPHVHLGYDTTIGIRETLDKLINHPTYIEEFIPDVKAEYRLLVSPDLTYIFERDIENVDGFPQACGSRGGMRYPIVDDVKLSKIAGDAKKLLNSVGWKYGSVDIFTTGDKWGIFECSSQFAADGVMPYFSSEIQQNLIQWLVKRYLEGESK